MRMQRCLVLSFACVLCGGAAWSDDGPVDESPAARLDRLLTATAAGSELEANAAELVPQLVKLVEQGDPQQIPLAIRALGIIGPESAPAVHLLCESLNDSEHAIRDFASDALVAIGTASIDPLHQVLSSGSPRARAAATVALHRLDQLEMAELIVLSTDFDPRVRAAAASALADQGQPGVELLMQLLGDAEAAVAVEAARALGVNRMDGATAIPALIEAIPRGDVGWAAAEALGAYGMEAQRAIPALIQAYPLGRGLPYGSNERVELALQHIGPPAEADIPALREILNCQNPQIRNLAEDALAAIGDNAPIETVGWESWQELTRDLGATEDKSLEELIAQVSDHGTNLTSHDAFEGRYDAAIALGRMGEHALPAIEALTGCLDDHYEHVRLHAATAIFRISGDTAPLRQQLQFAIAGRTSEQFDGIRILAELGPQAEPFLDIVISELDVHEPPYSEILVDALQAIGTAEARAALEEASQSTDWALRSHARTALRELSE